eukprot:361774-Chlamydomonas_euryale.AAC.1
MPMQWAYAFQNAAASNNNRERQHANWCGAGLEKCIACLRARSLACSRKGIKGTVIMLSVVLSAKEQL